MGERIERTDWSRLEDTEIDHVRAFLLMPVCSSLDLRRVREGKRGDRMSLDISPKKETTFFGKVGGWRHVRATLLVRGGWAVETSRR